jgi:hypothetical protein
MDDITETRCGPDGIPFPKNGTATGHPEAFRVRGPNGGSEDATRRPTRSRVHPVTGPLHEAGNAPPAEHHLLSHPAFG